MSDAEWLQANLAPSLYGPERLQVPALPSDEVQVRFTGRTTKENLQQAFDFYQFLLALLAPTAPDEAVILDFGGGWGRILRFSCANLSLRN